MPEPSVHESEYRNLLLEIGCEELPAKGLKRLSESLARGLKTGLQQSSIHHGEVRAMATPRRLAVVIEDCAQSQPEQRIQRRGPSLQVAFDEAGEPTRAAEAFAASVGVSLDQLDRQKTDKGEWLYYEGRRDGESLDTLFQSLVEAALKQLPIAKPMRWNDHDYSFIRPVHWLVALHGDQILPLKLFDLEAGRKTRGHRVHAPGPHRIDTADDYVAVLEAASVVADPARRRQAIDQACAELGETIGAHVQRQPALLEEVTHLVEYPVALLCDFDADFLTVPREALVASMQDHQKFFPVYRDEGGDELLPRFVAIANLDSADPEQVKDGFGRVIRPRLADARFFWQQDRKQALEDYFPALEDIVFQRELGTVADKCRRIADLAEKFADMIGADGSAARRAGQLSKCDLTTQMVGEFPELQGTMGRYYAAEAGEPEAVSRAIEAHYLPRFAGDRLPDSKAGQALALADRMDSLVGLFAAGKSPTGSKDPFALRRAAVGVIQIIRQGHLALGFTELTRLASQHLAPQIATGEAVEAAVIAFLDDRHRQLLKDEDKVDTGRYQAVAAVSPPDLLDFDQRLAALQRFTGMPEAVALSAANKRAANLLKKAENTEKAEVKTELLKEDEEKALFHEIEGARSHLADALERQDYDQALSHLAGLAAPLDQFFEQVMVMSEDEALRRNRLGLVALIRAQFLKVADISHLALK